MIITVNLNDHNNLLALISENREFGGSFNLIGNSLVIGKIGTENSYNRVEIPSGIVQFHTHPDCVGNRCSLSIPSAQDLIGFMKAFFRGDTLVHLLYTVDGIYIIMINKVFIRSNHSQKYINQFCKTLRKLLDSKINNIYNGKERYNPYNWINCANKNGFDIRLVSKNMPPKMKIGIK